MEWLAVSGKWHSYRRDAARHRDSNHIIPQPLQIATVIGTEHVRRGERIRERRGIMRAQHTLETERTGGKEERGWIGGMIRSQSRRLSIHNANCAIKIKSAIMNQITGCE